jgi:hypothetical protein
MKGHDYGKTRAFVATCPACSRQSRGLSTDGRVKTIVRSCSNPDCQERGLILTRDKTKDGGRYRARSIAPFGCMTAEVYHWTSGALVAKFLDLKLAGLTAELLTGIPPSRRGRSK